MAHALVWPPGRACKRDPPTELLLHCPPTLQPDVTVARTRSCNVEDAVCIREAARDSTTKGEETTQPVIQLTFTIKVETSELVKSANQRCDISTEDSGVMCFHPSKDECALCTYTSLRPWDLPKRTIFPMSAYSFFSDIIDIPRGSQNP